MRRKFREGCACAAVSVSEEALSGEADACAVPARHWITLYP
jgi:hypothetical protein